jgi:uncharacterized protein
MSFHSFLNPHDIDLVIHHSPCDDGHASAACFYHYNKNIELYGLHPKDTPDLTRVTGKNVVLVDICFDTETMRKMSQLAKKILVLDHHVTSKETMTQSLSESLFDPERILFYFVMGTAGVQLTWEYLCPDEDIPEALYYIGLKDVWKHEENERALLFTTGFQRPDTWDDWAPYVKNDMSILKKVMKRGITIHDYKQFVLGQMLEKVEYTTWRGYKMAFVNVPYPWISDIGALMCMKDPEKTIAVVWQKTVTSKYTVSLRSHNPTGPNCTSIALEFGGGGHVHGAGGILLDQPPFEIFKD